MRRARVSVLAVLAAAFGAGAAVAVSAGLSGQPAGQAGGAAGGQPAAQPGGQAGGGRAGLFASIGPMTAALREMPGCLGVEVLQAQSGKACIIAWFKDKKSVMEWYNHPTHQKMVDSVLPDRDKTRVPLKDLPEDAGPIMAVAGVMPPRPDPANPEGRPQLRLSIELYAALPGGLRLNGGSFSPDGFHELTKR